VTRGRFSLIRTEAFSDAVFALNTLLFPALNAYIRAH
jgi:hypothetical protein